MSNNSISSQETPQPEIDYQKIVYGWARLMTSINYDISFLDWAKKFSPEKAKEMVIAYEKKKQRNPNSLHPPGV